MQRNVIPPFGSPSKPAAKNESADLIDFGDDTPAAPVPAGNPSKDSAEIKHMLNATGHKAPDGPLIDFAADMKHDLPKAPGNLKRSGTQESNDVFFDVQS